MFHFSNFTNYFLIIAFVRVSIDLGYNTCTVADVACNNQQRAPTKAVVPGAKRGREERTFG